MWDVLVLIYTYSVPDMGACCIDAVKHAFEQDVFFEHCDIEASHLTHTVTLRLADEDAFKLLKTRDVHARVCKLLDDIGQPATPLEVKTHAPGFSHAHKGTLGLSVGFLILFLPLILTSMPFVLSALFAATSFGLTLALGWPFYRHAYRGLWQGHWTMDTLFSISTGIILLVSVTALFVPSLPMMFEASLLIFGFRHAGLAIDEAFKANIVTSTRLQDDEALPTHVRCQNRQNRMLPRDEIELGDIFYVSAGDILPVDGVFVSGAGCLSNKYKQGSERLAALVCEQKLDAGTKIMSAGDEQPLLFKAQASARDSFLAQEDQRILEAKFKRARENPLPKPKTTAYLLQFFIPAVVAVALVSGLIVGVYFSSWLLALQCMSTVLVAACPCTFGLITPLVIQVGILKFKKKEKVELDDVSFQIPEHLEAAAAVDCVVFDLNGTLTEGEPKVQCYRSYDSRYTDDELLALIATLEADEPHPIASAIRGKTSERVNGQRRVMKTPNGKSVVGGIHVMLDDVEYRLGNYDMMMAAEIDVERLDIDPCRSVVYLASNQHIMGYVILEDKPRERAGFVIKTLRDLGKKVCLCTGSDTTIAKAYATKFGIEVDGEHIKSNCPTDGINSKQAYVKALQDQGHTVAMVGDYSNDASAISASDVGLAVVHDGGHVAAQEAASAVIRDVSLLSVLQVFKVAERTVEHINQNLGFNLLYNMIAVLAPMGLLFGAGVMMNPAVGAALMMLQTVLIFANVYRFYAEEAHDEDDEALKMTPKPDLIPAHGNANISSISNGMRLAHTHGDGVDPKGALDGVDNTQSNSFDELKRVGFN